MKDVAEFESSCEWERSAFASFESQVPRSGGLRNRFANTPTEVAVGPA